jgi:hypothetical protein
MMSDRSKKSLPADVLAGTWKYTKHMLKKFIGVGQRK